MAIPGELFSQGGVEIQHGRSVTIPLAGHFKLSSKQCPQSQEEEEEKSRVPYSSAMGSLMYSMACTRSDFAYADRFMSNSEKQHWETVKWVLRYLRGTARLGLMF